MNYSLLCSGTRFRTTTSIAAAGIVRTCAGDHHVAIYYHFGGGVELDIPVIIEDCAAAVHHVLQQYLAGRIEYLLVLQAARHLPGYVDGAVIIVIPERAAAMKELEPSGEIDGRWADIRKVLEAG